jgi:hypothetical protein
MGHSCRTCSKRASKHAGDVGAEARGYPELGASPDRRPSRARSEASRVSQKLAARDGQKHELLVLFGRELRSPGLLEQRDHGRFGRLAPRL